MKQLNPHPSHFSRPRVVENFLDMMVAERGAAVNTLESYGRDLDHFSSYLKKRNSNPTDARKEHIRTYLKELSGLGLAASTISRRISTLRRFYSFLYSEKMREDDPCTAISAPKRKKVVPKYLNEK